MPGGDGTGPRGNGPLTGRALGHRHGWRREPHFLTLSKEEQKKRLEAHKEEIEKRLKELE